jgi:hypothetical protein
VASPRVVNIDDLRELARRRVPKIVFDYIDGGSDGEVTLYQNRRAFDVVTFRPRHAVAVAGAICKLVCWVVNCSCPCCLLQRATSA